jgi:hypothetical protein
LTFFDNYISLSKKHMVNFQRSITTQANQARPSANRVQAGQQRQVTRQANGPAKNDQSTWVASGNPSWKIGIKERQAASTPLLAQKKQREHTINSSPTPTKATPPKKTLAERSAAAQPAKKSQFNGLKGLFNKIGDTVNNAQAHKALSRAGYKPNEILSIGTVNQNNLQGEMKALGSGQLNTAYTAHFKQADGTLKELVIKFEAKYTSKKEMPDFLMGLGINPKDSRETARNLAAKSLDDLLGWNNIVHTEIGVLKDPKSGEHKVVTAMAKAEGISGYGKLVGYKPIADAQFKQYQRIKRLADKDPDNTMGNQDMLNNVLASLNVFSKSDLKEVIENNEVIGLEVPHRTHDINPQDLKLKTELIKLQLQDTIMSQGDRHIGNYFIKTEPGQDGKESVVSIQGIDNDQLGGTAKNIEAYSNLKDLPPEIPSQVCKDLIKLNPQEFQRQMECCLPKAEAEAATSRLKLVQEHAQKVLDNNSQNGEGSLLPGSKYDYNNSYYMNFLAAHFPDEAEKLANAA